MCNYFLLINQKFDVALKILIEKKKFQNRQMLIKIIKGKMCYHT